MSQVTDYKDSYRPEFSLIFKVSKKKKESSLPLNVGQMKKKRETNVILA